VRLASIARRVVGRGSTPTRFPRLVGPTPLDQMASRSHTVVAILRIARPRTPRGGALRSAAWKVVAYVVAGAFLLSYDGFGFSTATSTRSSDVLAQLFAGDYARAAATRPIEDQPAIVLVTDETLRHPAFLAEASEWPPRFDVHAKVLERVRQEQPRAVLIDVLFRDEDRGPHDRLHDVLTRYGGDSIPVLVASGAECPPGGPDLERELAASLVRPFRGLTLPVPVPALIERDRVTRRYQLWQTAASRTGCPTAALALHLLLSGNETVAGPAAAAAAIERSLRARSERTGNPYVDTLEIVWGAGVAGSGERGGWSAPGAEADAAPAGQPPCGAQPAPGLATSLAWSAAGHDLRHECPFIETIAAEDLLTSPRGTRLRGRPVFYAMSFLGSDDMILTPTSFVLPGVHQHAMAFDNLMAWGDGYLRRREPATLGPLTLPSGIDFALLLAGASLFALHRWARTKDRRDTLLPAIAAKLPGWLWTERREARPAESVVKDAARWAVAALLVVGVWLAPVALVLGTGWILFTQLRIAPVNWVAHLVVYGGVVALAESWSRIRDVHAALAALVHQDGATDRSTEEALDAFCSPLRDAGDPAARGDPHG